MGHTDPMQQGRTSFMVSRAQPSSQVVAAWHLTTDKSCEISWMFEERGVADHRVRPFHEEETE